MATYKRLGLKIKVHNNRIEIIEGFAPFRTKKNFPFRSIAAVSISGRTKRLLIITNDGREHKYAIGGLKAGRALAEINAQL